MEKKKKTSQLHKFPLSSQKNKKSTCAKTLLCPYDISNPIIPLLFQAYIIHIN